MKSIAKKAPKYYESDTGLPIFTCLSSSKKRIFTVSDLVTCLLHPRHDKRFFCRKVPTQISSNVAFIIDTSSLDNSEDIDSDDMGTWKNNRVDKSYVSVEITTNKVSSVAKTSGTSMKNGIFLVKRVYQIHGTDNSLRKITTSIYGML